MGRTPFRASKGGFFIHLFMSRLKTFLLLAGGLMVLLGAVCWYQFSRDRYIVRLYDTEDRYIAKMSYSFDDYYREHQIAPWLRWYWTVDANTAYAEWIYAAQDTPIAMKLLGKWDWKFLYRACCGEWVLKQGQLRHCMGFLPPAGVYIVGGKIELRENNWARVVGRDQEILKAKDGLDPRHLQESDFEPYLRVTVPDHSTTPAIIVLPFGTYLFRGGYVEPMTGQYMPWEYRLSVYKEGEEPTEP